MKHCTACGTALPEGARYCGACGAAVAGAGDPDATIPAPARSSAGPFPSPAPPSRARSSATPSSSAPTSSDGSYAPGTLIDERYRIVGLLGRGGMGEVYRADDLTLGQSVALKFLPDAVAHQSDRRERFLNEVRTARGIAHPNVCRVYDIGEVDGRVFLSMEYIDGEDLSSLLRRIGRLPQEKAVEIARSLCAGLGALHDRGVLHRDLKPANVMIDGRGRVRITDFGLSGVADEITGAEARAGTPAYMAPEQLTGERADERSDIFALGVTLYEVFTGKRAFEADSIAEISRLHRESTPTSATTIVPDLDDSVERVLGRCLDADADRRPPSAYAVAAALPGGDPLAAALAAGEVPSIEMVAAAGRSGGVRPIVGVACLLAAIAGVILYSGWGVRRAVYHWDSMEKPPDVLQDRAREIFELAGWDTPPVDETRGFMTDRRAMRWIAERDSSDTDWSRLGSRRPSAMHFWYRRGPEHLQAFDSDRGRPGYDDPPQILEGMGRLKLDTQGRLLELEAVPPQLDPPDSVDADPAVTDWDALIRAAGLEPAALGEADPEWVPADHADERIAWTFPLPDDPDVTLRVEGAAFRGKVVSFRVVGPWSTSERTPAGAPGMGDWVAEAVLIAILAAIIAAAVTLSIRNYRNGRGDRSGAFRLTLIVLGSVVVMWILDANHSSSPADEINMFFDAVAQGLMAAALFWSAYLALEPFVRSTWPGRIVGWSRVLTGRWRDPLVGRDILAGAVFFLVMVGIGIARIHLQEMLGHPAPRPSAGEDGVFLGAASTVAVLIQTAMNVVFNSFFFFLLLLLLRMVFRKMPLAMGMYVILFAATMWLTSSDVEKPSAPFVGLLLAAVWLFVQLRFGLLAFCVGFFFRQLVYAFPMTLDSSAWYAGTSYLAATVIIGITAIGFWLARSAPPPVVDPRDR